MTENHYLLLTPGPLTTTKTVKKKLCYTIGVRGMLNIT